MLDVEGVEFVPERATSSAALLAATGLDAFDHHGRPATAAVAFAGDFRSGDDLLAFVDNGTPGRFDVAASVEKRT